MKKLVLFLSFILVSKVFTYQKLLHQLYQIENTQKKVAQFLKNLNISFKSDTVYIFIIPPANALRIEGSINVFIHYLRKTGFKGDIITLIPYSKTKAVKKYFEKMGFTADYNLLIDEKFLNFFYLLSIYSPYPSVPFVTKFCVSKGELLASRSLMGKTDSASVFQFVSELSKPKVEKPKELSTKDLLKRKLKGEILKPALKRILKLFDTEDFPLSTTDWLRISPNEDYLALVDDLSFTIYIFDLKSGKLLNVLFSDTLEERKFIDIPPQLYQLLKKYITIPSMYVACDFYDDTTLFITATLPELKMKTEEKDTTIDYYNVACLIKKHIFSNKATKFIEFDSPYETYEGGYSHLNPSFVFEKGYVFCPFYKGWPYGAEMINEKVPLKDNPFSEEFYKKNIYLLVQFDFDGKILNLWGRLSPKIEKLKLGYMTRSGLVRFYNGIYYLSDGFSEKIYCYNEMGNLIDSIKVFEESDPILPKIDPNKEPLKYLVETFKLNYPVMIRDFIVSENECYLLISDWLRKYHEVYKINLKRNIRKRYILPEEIEDKKVKAYLLKKSNDKIKVISLLESPEETYYCEFIIP